MVASARGDDDVYLPFLLTFMKDLLEVVRLARNPMCFDNLIESAIRCALIVYQDAYFTSQI